MIDLSTTVISSLFKELNWNFPSDPYGDIGLEYILFETKFVSSLLFLIVL